LAPNYKHFLFVVTHTDAKTWEAILIIGVPTTFLDIIWFWVAFLKLRFYFRTRSALDGLSGLALLSMACSWAMMVFLSPFQALFPNVDVTVFGYFLLTGLVGGIVLFIVLRPYTRFGRSYKLAVSEEAVELEK